MIGSRARHSVDGIALTACQNESGVIGAAVNGILVVGKEKVMGLGRHAGSGVVLDVIAIVGSVA